ncbi:hypothetical protein IPJ72_05255 [Candidatus Peregrinibacteria bacterium]|nr:MAG: hypothetical protein IPJ72_05255 [Candidatus Peregrinibacteria bacterium]
MSPDTLNIHSLFFERIEDRLNDPQIVMGVTARLSAQDGQDGVPQEYIVSANLEKGDYDNDGSPDYQDQFPHHPQCTGDADADGICDEMDNCVLIYNPFQEDFDLDGVGDGCDSSAYGGAESGGESLGASFGGSGVFALNCSNDAHLLELITQQPTIDTFQMRQILLSSSPLPPSVLNALIENHPPVMWHRHFREVMVANTKLPDDVYQNVLNMTGLPGFDKAFIILAQALSEYIPWLGVNPENEVEYEVHLNASPDDYHAELWRVGNWLGDNNRKETDVFIFQVDNADGSEVEVTTQTRTESWVYNKSTNYLQYAGDSVIDQNGFEIKLEGIIGEQYVFSVNSVQNTLGLQAFEVNFGEGKHITYPSDAYTTYRYAYYCPGGCSENCGDTGTGILTGLNVLGDRCYRNNGTLPEWCSRWSTIGDDDSLNPAYIGGTQQGQDNLWWEKQFKTILSDSQVDSLESINVSGQIAYQSITQFFCDQLESSCPMKGVLMGSQNVQLFNWVSDSWETVGSIGADGESSDQQTFEVLYNGPDAKRFVGGFENRTIRARIQFNWDGVPPVGSESAPAFMVIDYLTLHLKW